MRTPNKSVTEKHESIVFNQFRRDDAQAYTLPIHNMINKQAITVESVHYTLNTVGERYA